MLGAWTIHALQITSMPSSTMMRGNEQTLREGTAETSCATIVQMICKCEAEVSGSVDAARLPRQDSVGFSRPSSLGLSAAVTPGRQKSRRESSLSGTTRSRDEGMDRRETRRDGNLSRRLTNLKARCGLQGADRCRT